MTTRKVVLTCLISAIFFYCSSRDAQAGSDVKRLTLLASSLDEKKSGAKPGNHSIKNDYVSRIRARLMNSWHPKGQGREIFATMRLSPKGQVTDLLVQASTPQEAAQKQIQELLARTQPFPPPPAPYDSQPCVWIEFDWDGHNQFVSGPYFDESGLDQIRLVVGKLTHPYDGAIMCKLMKAFDRSPDEGEALAYMKLLPDGKIAKVFLTTTPVSSQKFAYDRICKASPFGQVPASLYYKPYFQMRIRWGTKLSVHAIHLAGAPIWLQK